MILISACLIGERVRYDGGHKLNQKFKDLVNNGVAKPVCPEILGGLPTPREPAEIIRGNGDDVWANNAKVISCSGEDVTSYFKEGALKTLDICKSEKCNLIVLKQDSPSCGSSTIYSGNFNGEKKEGFGVTTSLLRSHGIEVIDEVEFENRL